jgi:hypothetical protein
MHLSWPLRSALQACVRALPAETISALPDEKSSVRDAQEQLLVRLLQHGHISTATVPVLLRALKVPAGREGQVPPYSRAVYYLVQLALGDGFAGTPVPMPPSRGTPVASGALLRSGLNALLCCAAASLTLAKAVDHFGPEVLSAAWADLGDERTPFVRKQGAMRALAALTHASLTSRPGAWARVHGCMIMRCIPVIL